MNGAQALIRRRNVRLAVLVVLYGCCTDVHLSLGRYRDSMDASLRLISDIDIDAFVSFDLDTSIGSWAGLSWLANAEFELDLDLNAVDFRIHKLVLDIDRDGVDEAIRLLAAVDRHDADNYRTIVAWKGDKYTLDKNTCYLSWLEQNTLVLVSARCGRDENFRRCQMQVDDPNSWSCQGCDRSGECVACDADDTVDDCKPRQEPIENTPIEEDAGLTDAAYAGFDAQQQSDAEPTDDADIDGGFEVDRTSCERKLDDLIGVASDCDNRLQPYAENLCESRPEEVDRCFLYYNLAYAFGQMPCVIISDPLACGLVFDAIIDLTACEYLLAIIRAAAGDCGREIPIELDTACDADAQDVRGCFSAYYAARSAGRPICPVLEQEAACSLLN
ncbi:MAG: hypothetical protein JXA30_19190 [Deltaproteobacteria bacterium]|nr:hypothetical protein [Deltaproteobacteria bacterium]